MFRAAGLIVPDPSIMSLPIPFNDVDTGCEVEYMATGPVERPDEAVRAEDDGDASKKNSGWKMGGLWVAAF